MRRKAATSSSSSKNKYSDEARRDDVNHKLHVPSSSGPMTILSKTKKTKPNDQNTSESVVVGGNIPLKHPIIGVCVVVVASLVLLLRNNPDPTISPNTDEVPVATESQLMESSISSNLVQSQKLSSSSSSSSSNLDDHDLDTFWKPRILYLKDDIHDVSTLPSDPFVTLDAPGEDENAKDRIVLSEEEIAAQEFILDSDEYSKKPEPLYTSHPPCEPQYDWMTKPHPVCNLLHEVDMTDMRLPEGAFPTLKRRERENIRFIATGGYRDVYLCRDYNFDELALKTLKWTRDFEERHYDRHKRDAMAADRLTSVPSSVDIYGYCGQSALYEFAKGGNLRTAIDRNIIRFKDQESELAWNSTRKLQVAYMIAESLADLHNVDQEGRASIAHTDVSTDQFISIKGDGYFQLNDFNRARFIKRNTEDNSNCEFFVKSNKGKFRSPEEYLYHGETEAVDTYSMGNIFFVMLTGTYPFPKLTKKEARKAVGKGVRPEFTERLLNNPDPNEKVLIDATRMCWLQDPKERASARDIQLFLQSKLNLSKQSTLTVVV